MKWGDNQRDFDTILAVWPKYRPLQDVWFLEEFVDRGDLPPHWRDRRVPSNSGGVRADVYTTHTEALAQASALNQELESEFEARQMPSEVRSSLRLKVIKNLQAKERLASEEALMLAQAKLRHAKTPRLLPTQIDLQIPAESYRNDLVQQLDDMPYLRLAIINNSGRRVLLRFKKDKSWYAENYISERDAIYANRACIAHGFNIAASAHWGKTKATIRQILLPRANQLLKLESVKRLLAENLAAGRRVLVCNGIVFWYEEDGGVGWQVKTTAPASKSEDGATIWKEGTIISKNHGRLVILPYIKENGEYVPGHTRNAPHDGPALPRHPDAFVKIPFEQLNSDLMIGLMGELPYD